MFDSIFKLSTICLLNVAIHHLENSEVEHFKLFTRSIQICLKISSAHHLVCVRLGSVQDSVFVLFPLVCDSIQFRSIKNYVQESIRGDLVRFVVNCCIQFGFCLG